MNVLNKRKPYWPQQKPVVALPGPEGLPKGTAGSGSGTTNDGASVIPQNGFNYAHEDAYQRLLQRAAGQSTFRYNPNSDPVMRAYTQAYRREGERATANALAQAAAATGGVPSSYAVGAAQQAGAYYASQLADKFPELEQQAYNRYLNERAASLQELEALGADRADAYNKYLKEQELAALKQQQEQLAAQEAAKLLLDNSSGVSQAIINYVSKITNGTMQVTDPYWWEELLADNTEEQLKAAGITYTGP